MVRTDGIIVVQGRNRSGVFHDGRDRWEQDRGGGRTNGGVGREDGIEINAGVRKRTQQRERERERQRQSDGWRGGLISLALSLSPAGARPSSFFRK